MNENQIAQKFFNRISMIYLLNECVIKRGTRIICQRILFLYVQRFMDNSKISKKKFNNKMLTHQLTLSVNVI